MTTPAPDPSDPTDERARMGDWFDTVSWVNDYAGQLPVVVGDDDDEA